MHYNQEQFNFLCILAKNRLKYGENEAIDLIFNYWGKIKIDINSMMVDFSAKVFLGIIGTWMGLFETGFRIFIFAMIISESAVDLIHLTSQTEVHTCENGC